jgi:hypothetical protein
MRFIERAYAREMMYNKDFLALSHASVTAITWRRGDQPILRVARKLRTPPNSRPVFAAAHRFFLPNVSRM